jgi:peroxiredoxin
MPRSGTTHRIVAVVPGRIPLLGLTWNGTATEKCMTESPNAETSLETQDDPFELMRELNEARELYRNHEITADVLAKLNQQSADLLRTEIVESTPAVGERAPGFRLPAAAGREVSLARLLHFGLVVLTFYRGRWCPYCNLSLRGLQQLLPVLNQLNASLVAISPQPPDNALSRLEEAGPTFEVLSDGESTIAKAYGLEFEIPAYLREVYRRSGHPLAKFNGHGQHTISVPATFVIDRDSIVRYRFVDPDHTRRADLTRLLDIVRRLTRADAAPAMQQMIRPRGGGLR